MWSFIFCEKTFLSPTIATRSTRLLPDLILNVLPMKEMGDAGSRTLGSWTGNIYSLTDLKSATKRSSVSPPVHYPRLFLWVPFPIGFRHILCGSADSLDISPGWRWRRGRSTRKLHSPKKAYCAVMGTLLSITRIRRISSSSSVRGTVNLEDLPDAGNRMSFPVSSSLNSREQLIEEWLFTVQVTN